MTISKEQQTKDEWVNIVDPFAKRLIARYLGRREKDLELLRSSLTENDFEFIRIKGHNLSGSGSAYGLDRISELGKLLEEAATDNNQGAIAEHIDALESYIHRLHVS